ncbi:MAG: malto-oligosyltrehalose synthase [Actinomycetota bacterium]|nr:malto-oligosyltrehalose synthase [Actinomycetota bacterium]
MSHPAATYRLQLRPSQDLDDAAALAPYLAMLGVSHAYTSPVLQAAPGSTHGYDVVDPTRISEQLGGEAARERFTAALTAARLGWVLDVVPNHMATDLPANRWWWEVLEHGRAARHAKFFDLDPDRPEAAEDTVTIPVLGERYDRILAEERLRLVHRDGRFHWDADGFGLPAAIASLAPILSDAAQRASSSMLAALAGALDRLPSATDLDEDALDELRRERIALADLVAEVVRREPALSAAIDDAVAGHISNPAQLDEVLSRQHHRLRHWRTAIRHLGYRRFFTIDSLVGLRQEDPDVFDTTHARILELVRAGEVDGLRIDHPDGLRRPGRYLERLREKAGPGTWIVVEKILEGDEQLPATWPVDGTTGYDLAAVLDRVFTDPDATDALTAFHARFAQQPERFEDAALDARHQMMEGALATDVDRVSDRFARWCASSWRHKDHHAEELDRAVRELVARFPVYRAYLQPEGATDDADARLIRDSAARAADDVPQVAEALDLLARVLVGEESPSDQRAIDLRLRFCQLTATVNAKGVEDTAFYRWNRLAAHNEVGADPGTFAVSADAFHAHQERVQASTPGTMTTLSTHDTKRSEDVRARLRLLAEVPDDWTALVERLSARVGSHMSDVRPEPALEYLAYQTFVGAHPLEPERLFAYLDKASREAKTATSWVDADEDYDAAVRRFAELLYADPVLSGDLTAFAERLVEPGRVASLAQKLVQLTSPGVPDVYQGTELWDLSLVDPDNRRPVDFVSRRQMLKSLTATTPEKAALEALANTDEGMPKLWVTHRGLCLRRDRPAAFGPDGSYRPIRASGPAADHVLAFARGEEVVTVVPRLVLRLDGRWDDTTLDLGDGPWTDVLTGAEWPGGTVRLAELLGRFPVALLERA